MSIDRQVKEATRCWIVASKLKSGAIREKIADTVTAKRTIVLDVNFG